MSFWDDDDDEDFDDWDWDDYEPDPVETGQHAPVAVGSNPAPKPSFTGEVEVDMVGKQFSTGNSVVKTLPVGATLKVVGQSRLEVVDVPKPVLNLNPGSRFRSKYGPATVVRVTNTADLSTIVKDNIDDDDIVYIADGTNVVRVTSRDAAKAL